MTSEEGTTGTGRVCGRIGCANSIEHLRRDAVYCSSTCRREAVRARAGGEPPGPTTFRWSRLRTAGIAASRRARDLYRPPNGGTPTTQEDA